MATSDLTTLCSLTRQLLWVLSPANSWTQLRWIQGAVPGSGFGAGGNNLVVADTNGNAKATQISPVPPGVRSVLLRNLSTTKTIIYWQGTAQQNTPPANGYSTLPANGVVAIDCRADDFAGFWFMPDPASTDAGLEVIFSSYDPTKAPGPQVPPFLLA